MSVAKEIRDFTLILTGGGMRCAWSGGFLYGLNEMGVRPATLVACSGNSGNAAYFCADKMEAVRRIWTEYLPGEDFISFFRIKKTIDIDFLVDEVLRKREPIDWKDVTSSAVKILCPIREAGGKHIKLNTNADMSYEILRAAKALPLFYGKKIQIEGILYQDYPFSPAELVSFAPKDERIIVIDVRPQNRFMRFLGKLIMRPEKSHSSLPKDTVVIKPDINYHFLTSSKPKLTEMFENGRLCAREYKDFFSKQ